MGCRVSLAAARPQTLSALRAACAVHGLSRIAGGGPAANAFRTACRVRRTWAVAYHWRRPGRKRFPHCVLRAACCVLRAPYMGCRVSLAVARPQTLSALRAAGAVHGLVSTTGGGMPQTLSALRAACARRSDDRNRLLLLVLLNSALRAVCARRSDRGRRIRRCSQALATPSRIEAGRGRRAIAAAASSVHPEQSPVSGVQVSPRALARRR